MIFKHIPKKVFLLLVGDVLLISISYVVSPFIRHGVSDFRPLTFFGIGSTLAIYIFAFYLMGLYDFEVRFKSPKYLFRFLVAVTIASTMEAAMYYYIPTLRSGRGIYLISAILICFLNYSWRLLFERWFIKFIQREKRILIIGAGWAGNTLYKMLDGNDTYKVVGFVDDDPSKHGQINSPEIFGDNTIIHDLIEKHKIDLLIVAITHLKGPRLLKNVLDCKMDGVLVYDMPSFYEEITGKVPVEHVNDFWFVNTPLSGVIRGIYTQKVKRVLDIIFSTIGLIISLPVILLTAIAIKLESKGPILHIQKRVGLNGKLFNPIKFRTMRVGTESDRQFAGMKDDPRITNVGRLLRLFRIDEILQMWNVLNGEMSFIGPRALIEDEVSEFEKTIPYFSLRHSIRPGITGWAQVNYRHGATVEDALEKLQYDLFYIKNLTPLLEFHILLKTVKVVLSGRGAR